MRATFAAVLFFSFTAPVSAQPWLKDQRYCEAISAAAESGALDHITRKQLVQLACGLPSVTYKNTPAANACRKAIYAVKDLYVRRPRIEESDTMPCNKTATQLRDLIS